MPEERLLAMNEPPVLPLHIFGELCDGLGTGKVKLHHLDLARVTQRLDLFHRSVAFVH